MNAGAAVANHSEPLPELCVDPDPVRHLVVGARGGQGATTVAVALAAIASRQQDTTLVAHDPDALCAMAGLPSEPPDGPVELAPRLTLANASGPAGNLAVIDVGPLHLLDPTEDVGAAPGAEHRWLVVRGPCYLSLRAAVAHPWRPDGVILLTEPRRALGARDVSDVLGVPVVAEIPQDHRVARAIDAGTLLATVSRLESLAGLRSIVPSSDLSPTPVPHAAQRMSQRLDRLQHPAPDINPSLGR